MMKRMVNANRVAALLKPHGFVLEWDSGCSRVTYSRPGLLAELWEDIHLGIGGKGGDWVHAEVGVSVGYSVSLVGLGEGRYVPESARGQKNGYRFRDAADAESWEREMADILPGLARCYAQQAGPIILVRTAEARAATHRYVELFGTKDLGQLREKLELRATTNEMREARRIAAAMSPLPKDQELYAILALGIILHSDSVEGRQIAPSGVQPIPEGRLWSGVKSPDWSLFALAWRLQLIADRWLSRYPDPMPRRYEDWCSDLVLGTPHAGSIHGECSADKEAR